MMNGGGVALLPQSNKGMGLIPNLGTVSVEFACYLHVCVGATCMLDELATLNCLQVCECERVCDCLSLKVSPVMNWRLSQDVPCLSTNVSWDGRQHSQDPAHDKR